MARLRFWQDRGLLILCAMALFVVAVHTLTNSQYGFHRDELATLDDAGRLARGYVAYPPLTPLIARVGLELFGPAPAGIRLFAAIAQALALILGGLMAREMGGGRWAQIVAGASVAIAPVSVSAGFLFQYVSFDYLWWVLLAYLLIRLLKSEDPRWWIAIGAVAGVAMLTKYTILFLLTGLLAGVLLTPARRYLRSGWLWAGIGVALLIWLPNLIWQVQHHFIYLDFIRHIHERDVRIGRTDHFLIGQFLVTASPFTVPFWIAGLRFYFMNYEGKRYRLIGWMFIATFLLFYAAKGRDYYMAPAYPMLLAAGAVVGERWIARLSPGRALAVRSLTWSAIAVGGVLAVAVILPISPINSSWWKAMDKWSDSFREEVGWQDLTFTVAAIRDSLPASDRQHLGILAGNYGEAGAIDLYGPAYGLPQAIGGIDSYWEHGYGNPPAETLIVVGISREFLERHFESVVLAAHNTNSYDVLNEETKDHPDIFVCRRLRGSWAEFWKTFQYFG
ncbi:MAG: glycosyltransferase family 39 protein [Terracidiphilus sp.]|jgi:4-amino-4-deoxy-L-arabinose transferase-like glycosyltransferase